MTTEFNEDLLAIIEDLVDRVTLLETNFDPEERSILQRINDYEKLLVIYRLTPNMDQAIAVTERAIKRLKMKLGRRSG